MIYTDGYLFECMLILCAIGGLIFGLVGYRIMYRKTDPYSGPEYMDKPKRKWAKNGDYWHEV